MSLFDNFVDNLPSKEKKTNVGNSGFSGSWSDQESMALARKVISDGGLGIMREGLKGSDYYFSLTACVFDNTHKNNDAAIIVKNDGTLGYHCFHNSCEMKTWADVRALISPKEKKEFVEKKKITEKTSNKDQNTRSIVDLVSNLYNNGMSSGLNTGWELLDKYYTVMPGQWTIVTGIPSHGKSSFLDALLVNLAKSHGFKTAIFSPENHPIQVHCSKLIETVTGEPFYSSYMWDRMSAETMTEGAKFIDKYFKFITYGDEILSLDNILSSAASLIENCNVGGLVIDPWNEINHAMGTDSETSYISKALTKVRVFARKHNIHVWIVAHPTKLQKNSSGNYDPPTPYDISGSAHWRNKADCAITVHRPTFAPKNYDVDIHIQKIRFKHVGQTGKVPFTFNLTNNQYNERDEYQSA